MQKFKILSFLILAVIVIACDPFHTQIGSEVSLYKSNELTNYPAKDTLKIMTWNIKFGGARIDFFFDCHGDRVIMEKEEVETNLKQLAEKIQEVDPDILFIQEADINAKRSAYIDQVQYLLNHTGLNYGVYASQWKANYIPSDGIGRMDSGNAILSKWQFTNAKRIALPLIAEQNFIVRYFYLKRNILEAQIQINNKNLHLLTTHASAYAQDDTKKKQLEIICNYTDSIAKNKEQVILGGDFNTLPPFSKQIQKFDDTACTDGEFEADDYSKEITWMQAYYDRFTAAIPLENFIEDNQKHYTHTTDKKGFWNRKLDYIFTNGKFINNSGKTLQQWMKISDHAPIIVSYEL